MHLRCAVKDNNLRERLDLGLDEPRLSEVKETAGCYGFGTKKAGEMGNLVHWHEQILTPSPRETD